MKLRLKALRSLRLNYKWRGVWVWLKGRAVRRCIPCQGDGRICKHPPLHIPPCGHELKVCPACLGDGKQFGKRGYQRILFEPKQVLAEQEATAEGVFV